MLFISFLLILVGTGTASAAAVVITYLLVASSQKPGLNPKYWPDGIKKWVKIGGAGFGSALLGMIAASLAAR